jgi:hypothetical protein
VSEFYVNEKVVMKIVRVLMLHQTKLFGYFPRRSKGATSYTVH